MAEYQRVTAELEAPDLRRLSGHRDTRALADSLRLAVGETATPDPSIPPIETEATASAAPQDEPATAEGDSDG